MLRMWADAVEGYALELLLKGEAVPGFKLVAGRTNRSWADEEAAAQWLVSATSEDEALPRSLVSPAQAEKLLKHYQIKNPGELVAQYAVKRTGTPTIAPATDPRPELSPFSEFAAEVLT